MKIILDLPRNAGENVAGGKYIHAHFQNLSSRCSVHVDVRRFHFPFGRWACANLQANALSQQVTLGGAL